VKTAQNVAYEVYRLYTVTVGRLELEYDMVDQDWAKLWLPNGYGVSLINYGDDELPELMAKKRDAHEHVEVKLPMGWSTDPMGVRRMCDVQDVINVLVALKERGK